jgi:hypothetical protein
MKIEKKKEKKKKWKVREGKKIIKIYAITSHFFFSRLFAGRFAGIC